MEVFDILKKEYEMLDKSDLNIIRSKLEIVIYKILDQKYGQIFDDFWNISKLPEKSDKTIFITERREHPNLKFILRNAHYYCPDWSITIHCSSTNIDYIKVICYPHNPTIKVVFDCDETPEKGKKEYNEHLKKLSTWESIDAEHILIMETDAYLLKPIPDKLLEYDYVASAYNWDKTFPGGGGLTLRKKSAMIDICQNISPDDIEMQDMYAAYGCIEYGHTWAHITETYFVESYIYDKQVVGVHQWWTFIDGFLSYPDIIELLMTCHSNTRLSEK